MSVMLCDLNYCVSGDPTRDADYQCVKLFLAQCIQRALDLSLFIVVGYGIY